MDNRIPLFVYGTLRKGYGNHRLMGNSECLGLAVLYGAYMVASGIPFLKKSDNPSEGVVGEVYMVEPDRMRSIDALEGHPRWYQREMVPVKMQDGKAIEAWAYFYPHEERGLQRIKSGDYHEYRRSYV